MEHIRLADPDAVEVSGDLGALFQRCMDDMVADEATSHGELPSADELADRAEHGAGDVLSSETAQRAARFGERFGERRWRVAAVLTLRRWAAWLAYCFRWPILCSHLDEIFAEPPMPWERPDSPSPPVGGSIRVARAHPRTGPPNGAARIGACP